jgi:hypothetical protein
MATMKPIFSILILVLCMIAAGTVIEDTPVKAVGPSEQPVSILRYIVTGGPYDIDRIIFPDGCEYIAILSPGDKCHIEHAFDCPRCK